jgi:hypothetical protein
VQKTTEYDDDAGLEKLVRAAMLSWTGSRAYLTWMMNKMMGFFESYTDGSSPSRIPPCGLARSVLEALAALTVLVTTLVTTSVTVDIAAVR